MKRASLIAGVLVALVGSFCAGRLALPDTNARVLENHGARITNLESDQGDWKMEIRELRKDVKELRGEVFEAMNKKDDRR